MRLLTYNIAYGTGCPKSMSSSILTAHRYLKTPRRSIDRICRFIQSYSPDIAALIEVDTGSFRTGYLNQADLIAARMKTYPVSGIKYGEDSIGRKVPILRRQANTILSKDKDAGILFHYFPFGFKRLVLELVHPGLHVFVVHLALQSRTRAKQLEYLKTLFPQDSPFMITGDFNTLHGRRELDHLCMEQGLLNVNFSCAPTFPSWNAEKELDFILCSAGVIPKGFLIPQIRFSDHLPLIFDFDLES